MNYLDARRSLMFSVHFNLRNISTLLYNIEEASDSDLISNRLPYLKCIILDTTIGNLSLLKNDITLDISFEDFYETVFQYLEENDLNGIYRCQEMIEKTLNTLSEKDNSADNSILNPNYNISTKEYLINDSLEEILPNRFK